MKARVLRGLIFLLLLTASLTLGLVRPSPWLSSAYAKPAFMDRYNRDPYAKANWKDKCTLCHIGRGGEQRNEFGEAFEDAGYRITPRLREKFPQFFLSPSQPE